MLKHGYRYFDQELQPGQTVLPKADHFPNLRPDQKRAEAAIRSADPRGPLRAQAVFVFEDRSVAEELLNETDGEHLYEVLVEPQEIVSRSDLRIYDEVVEALERGQSADLLIREFWSGVERPSPRIELTVRKAIVQRKLIDDQNK